LALACLSVKFINLRRGPSEKRSVEEKQSHFRAVFASLKCLIEKSIASPGTAPAASESDRSCWPRLIHQKRSQVESRGLGRSHVRSEIMSLNISTSFSSINSAEREYIKSRFEPPSREQPRGTHWKFIALVISAEHYCVAGFHSSARFIPFPLSRSHAM
jgi:hypothetical protein